MFAYEHVVKLHDTDCYGIIFFANQFRICHDAWQAFLAQDGIPLLPDRHQLPVLPVMVHAESDYIAKVVIGDHLRIELEASNIGTTSFTLSFRIANQHGATGSARHVHVCISADNDQKVDIPPRLRAALQRI